VLLLLVAASVSILLRDDDVGTVATSPAAEDATGADRAAGGAEAGPSAEAAAPTPAGDGVVEVRRDPDGSVAARLGATTTQRVRPGGIAAAVEGGTVFGLVPAGVGSVQVSADVAPGVTNVVIADLVPADGDVRTFTVGGFGQVQGAIRVEAGGQSVLVTGGR
jgi:hypothetical protein